MKREELKRRRAAVMSERDLKPDDPALISKVPMIDEEIECCTRNIEPTVRPLPSHSYSSRNLQRREKAEAHAGMKQRCNDGTRSVQMPRESATCFRSSFVSLKRIVYLRAGEVESSRLTSGWAEAGAVCPPVTISLAPISLPYRFLLASLSASIDAPSRETPANSPLERE